MLLPVLFLFNVCTEYDSWLVKCKARKHQVGENLSSKPERDGLTFGMSALSNSKSYAYLPAGGISLITRPIIVDYSRDEHDNTPVDLLETIQNSENANREDAFARSVFSQYN